MKAYTHTSNGTIVTEIQECPAPFSEKEMERITNSFNRNAKAIEFAGGTTYCIEFKGHKATQRLKSSSLDELLEMYKCAWKGVKVPERKCFFIPNYQIKVR